jgi:hypothetical protein
VTPRCQLLLKYDIILLVKVVQLRRKYWPLEYLWVCSIELLNKTSKQWKKLLFREPKIIKLYLDSLKLSKKIREQLKTETKVNAFYIKINYRFIVTNYVI